MRTKCSHTAQGRGTDEYAISLSHVCFRWSPSQPPVVDIDGLEVRQGSRLFVAGPSGSGKSTLLGLLAGILTPQKGSVSLLGRELSTMSAPQRDHFRADHIGYIFQQFNLVPYLSMVENVTLPLRFSPRRRETAGRHAARDEAVRLLEYLGLTGAELRRRSVTELSVGQQQRVAAARALIGGPEILIADEPTSSLDAAHRSGFLDLLFQECEAAGTTLVFVSHDDRLGKAFDETMHMGLH